ncbi:hypothetical protein Bbelb_286960 [Branchiostoma belcheri]|nr:hypothetical protein Bbelb_286960 [Branchiostoma belcheri]
MAGRYKSIAFAFLLLPLLLCAKYSPADEQLQPTECKGNDCISDKGPTQLEEDVHSSIKDGIPTEYRPPQPKDGTTWTHTNYPGEHQKSRDEQATWHGPRERTAPGTTRQGIRQTTDLPLFIKSPGHQKGQENANLSILEEHQDVDSSIPASFTWRQDKRQNVDSPILVVSFTRRQAEHQDADSPIPAPFTWRQHQKQHVDSPILVVTFTRRQEEHQNVDSPTPARFTWRQDEQQGIEIMV